MGRRTHGERAPGLETVATSSGIRPDVAVADKSLPEDAATKAVLSALSVLSVLSVPSVRRKGRLDIRGSLSRARPTLEKSGGPSADDGEE